ncbi:MAG TPA: bifunctional phosphopantothenoylcysteine decarboxylase/phosphopantothenate--cysteine ligase CoaBC [Thermoplasmata archaeon]|nr:bifunctional phosphopantothenoylcysteine decarboxylase/phosphopantothenate--cysteine ligase CoaBC [Thermoplasmata archaeon]
MHPSRAIRSARSELLAGKRVVIGVSGSIAAIEIPRVARELIRHGAEVRVVMSAEATRILTPEAVEFATGHPPITALTGAVEHVTEMAPGPERADLLLLAPATANTLSKVAHGIDDTPVTSFASVALGGGVPVLAAPAMHADMARNPAVVESLERLVRFGVGIIAPRAEEGEEKIPTPEEVAAEVLHRLASGPWYGRRLLIIGGASREKIDDVRSVTNESSGETAVALARQAYYRGAEVHLWLGASEHAAPRFVRLARWRSVEELLRLVRGSPGLPAPLDSVWVPAALSDFTVDAAPGKIESRRGSGLTLELRAAPKVLPELRSRAPPPTILVAFKLASGATDRALLGRARDSRAESGADWVVANDATNMGSAEGGWWLVPPRGEARRIVGRKEPAAGELLDAVGSALGRGAPREGRGVDPERPGPTPRRSRGPSNPPRRR